MKKYRITINPYKTSSERWRAQAQWLRLSDVAHRRLEWLIFYYSVGERQAGKTAQYFGIHRSCLYEWLKKFNPLDVTSLEEKSRRPTHLRQWTVTHEEETRIKKLREQYIYWGKQKLKRIYQKVYREEISTWKIERVIRKHHLYPNPIEHKKKMKIRKNREKRVRIHTLNASHYEPGTLWHVDTIISNWYGQKRSIVTAIEDKTKLGYARVYKNHSSRSAADFLKRLVYLSHGDISIVHSDNGSEFAGEFKEEAKDMSIFQVYSRVRTPNDNPALERFNRTLQEEWLAMSEVGLDDIHEANQDLTNWLIEYNSVRPHQSLAYLTPIEYAYKKYFHVSPMYPASTDYCCCRYNSYKES